MKLIQTVAALGCAFGLLAGSAIAADKPANKLTCCQEAQAKDKECSHKCCVAAHREGKSCQKCNPNKEDLKLKKEAKKTDKK